MQASIAKLLRDVTASLATVTETPQLEAEILLAHAYQKPRSYLYAHANELVAPEIQTIFMQLITQRADGKPIAYLTEHKEFWSLDLMVTADTLIPRPETEILIEQVLNQYPHKKITLADLGTGSGAIALALAHERPEWIIYATDQSAAALVIAKNNANRLGIHNITFLLGDWCSALSSNQFDVIVSNPPYLTEKEGDNMQGDLQFEPRSALVSGFEGLDAIRIIISSAKQYLKKDGMLFIEHGYQQGEAIRELFATAGYHAIQTHWDLAGLERVTFANA